MMVDMDMVMSAMNAGVASKISPVIVRAHKKAALAAALVAKKIEAAKKVTNAKTGRIILKKPKAKSAGKKTDKKTAKRSVKKAAANKKVARKTAKRSKKSKRV
jgi:hypothetical protein